MGFWRNYRSRGRSRSAMWRIMARKRRQEIDDYIVRRRRRRKPGGVMGIIGVDSLGYGVRGVVLNAAGLGGLLPPPADNQTYIKSWFSGDNLGDIPEDPYAADWWYGWDPNFKSDNPPIVVKWGESWTGEIGSSVGSGGLR